MSVIKRAAAFAAIIVAIVIGSLWRPAAAQATRNDDVLPALLTEVRGLRAAMEQMASGSTQAQLLVGRLQLQEGRITSMIRRLDTVRDNLASARSGASQIEGSMRMLLQGDGQPNANVPQSERNELFAGIKAQVEAAKAEVDRLTAEEAQLMADIAGEQQRWIAINQRLDDLERSLAKR